eukprot:Unigene2615_Nuclearia_a/m.8088 Unigene2615_Nuclearia_a/g.8088  ORF Unigene2615_Nuclearia_a/g.8088 Unigene2615_Nuclearia_a/m.8088 type:complete len:493 (+) Unigene2615_Nuclearia_a:1830-3308(+)
MVALEALLGQLGLVGVLAHLRLQVLAPRAGLLQRVRQAADLVLQLALVGQQLVARRVAVRRGLLEVVDLGFQRLAASLLPVDLGRLLLDLRAQLNHLGLGALQQLRQAVLRRALLVELRLDLAQLHLDLLAVLEQVCARLALAVQAALAVGQLRLKLALGRHGRVLGQDLLLEPLVQLRKLALQLALCLLELVVRRGRLALEPLAQVSDLLVGADLRVLQLAQQLLELGLARLHLVDRRLKALVGLDRLRVRLAALAELLRQRRKLALERVLGAPQRVVVQLGLVKVVLDLVDLVAQRLALTVRQLKRALVLGLLELHRLEVALQLALGLLELARRPALLVQVHREQVELAAQLGARLLEVLVLALHLRQQRLGFLQVVLQTPLRRLEHLCAARHVAVALGLELGQLLLGRRQLRLKLLARVLLLLDAVLELVDLGLERLLRALVRGLELVGVLQLRAQIVQLGLERLLDLAHGGLGRLAVGQAVVDGLDLG